MNRIAPASTKATVDLGPAFAELRARSRELFRACPLCDSKDIHKLREADCSGHPLYQPVISARMIWMACKQCRHVFTDGYFSAETFKDVFSTVNPHQAVGWEMESQRAISARIVERVASYMSNGAWLDVGFGNGSLLLTAQEWGFEPVGVDLRRDNVQDLQKRGIEGHCVDLHKLDHAGRYSVISMADVLEHIPFPKDALSAVHRLLRVDGVLFVSMPNYDSPVWSDLDSKNANPYWGELEHFHNFSRQRLYHLFEEVGFAPLNYAISQRYRIGMEVISRRTGEA